MLMIKPVTSDWRELHRGWSREPESKDNRVKKYYVATRRYSHKTPETLLKYPILSYDYIKSLAQGTKQNAMKYHRVG